MSAVLEAVRAMVCVMGVIAHSNPDEVVTLSRAAEALISSAAGDDLQRGQVASPDAAAPAAPVPLRSRSEDDRQVLLFGRDHDPVGRDHDPVGPDHDPVGPDHDPVGPDQPSADSGRPADEPSRTCDAPSTLARNPSSSSDLDPSLFEEKKKKTDREVGVTLEPNQEITDWATRWHARMLTLKPDLPPLDFVWASFVEWIVDNKKRYATQSGLVKRYRDFLRYEQPLLFKAPAPADVAPESGVVAAAPLASYLAAERQAHSRMRGREAVQLAKTTRAGIAELVSFSNVSPPSAPCRMMTA